MIRNVREILSADWTEPCKKLLQWQCASSFRTLTVEFHFYYTLCHDCHEFAQF